MPPAGILPRLKRARPYVYSDAEVGVLLAAALALPPAAGLRRWTYHLFGLIAVTGMSLSEAIGLQRSDVDLDEGVLTIRQANSESRASCPCIGRTREARDRCGRAARHRSTARRQPLRRRPMPASTASSCCAPTQKSPPFRSSCATATLAVEDAFRTAKALLATRPIFHKTDAGIRGHVFCTFLALVLRKELIDRLAARHRKLEWQRIIDDLADLSEIQVEQDDRRALLRTAPGPTIDPICRAIGLTLPPVFQEMPPAL